MTKRRFLARRTAAWRRFEHILREADSLGRGRLNPRAVGDFSRLLREVSHDLATVRAQGWDARLEAYLNDLTARGHTAFYRAPPGTVAAVSGYLAGTFPRLMRRNAGYMAAGLALFFVPFFAVWAAVVIEPELSRRVIPGPQLEQIEAMYGDDRADSDDAGFGDARSAMFGFYIMNNVGIALRTFALGITFGVGTVVTLLSNGIVIGAVIGHVQAAGHGGNIFPFVVGHGAFELTAIGIAGGAGLMIADALLHPGNRTRGEALRVRGGEAVQVAGGAAAMLTVAALLEAFWSPAPLPPVVKYAVGGLLWLLVAAYIALAGRGGETPGAEP